LVTIVASIATLINYGFGLVVGALLSIQIAKRVPSVDYRLLVASAYSAFVLWHGGLSGSIPLLIATDDHFFTDVIGSLLVIGMLFSGFYIFIVVLFLMLLFLNLLLLKSREGLPLEQKAEWDTESFEAEFEEIDKENGGALFPSERLENSQIISLVIGLLGMVYAVFHFID